jgi:hypothetical protein
MQAGMVGLGQAVKDKVGVSRGVAADIGYADL